MAEDFFTNCNDNLNEIKQFCLTQLALYVKPEIISYLGRQRYGDKFPTAEEIKKIRIRYRKEIEFLRTERYLELPILNPEQRWFYLQSIIDQATNDRVKLQALKLAHELTKQAPDNTDELMVRKVIIDTYKELKALSPERSHQEIVQELINSLGLKVENFIEELEFLAKTENK